MCVWVDVLIPLIVSLSSFLRLLFVTLAIPFLPVPGVGTVLPSPGRGRAGARGAGGIVGYFDLLLLGESVVWMDVMDAQVASNYEMVCNT